MPFSRAKWAKTGITVRRPLQLETRNAESNLGPGDGVSNAMSCKIERIISREDSVVLRVSGRIDREHLDTLRDSIAREKGRVALDLTEVRFVAREAVGLLAVSEANGVEVRNCPAYIREWVTKERDIG